MDAILSLLGSSNQVQYLQSWLEGAYPHGMSGAQMVVLLANIRL